MNRYFKLVALHDGWEDWMFEQFMKGRVHFGWGGPETDLRAIQEKPRKSRNAKEALAWKYCQFLLNRLEVGDRLVLQFKRPLRQFLIAEVTGPYGFLDPPELDFNHYRECKPLTTSFISVDSDLVPEYLRHALTKRGHYYQIYPQQAIKQLDRIISEELWKTAEAQAENPDTRDLGRMEDVIRSSAFRTISEFWPAKAFERFVARLLQAIPGVEVLPGGDSGKGWDLLMRFLDPVTGKTLLDEIPVQCKNFTGEVTTLKPLDDIERAIRNSDRATRGYIFILGKLGSEFEEEAAELENNLRHELNRDISIQIVDEAGIANLYLQHLAGRSDF